MKTPLRFIAALVAALFFAWLGLFHIPAHAATSALSPKDETVKRYIDSCSNKSAKDAGCDKLRKDAVEILKEDLHTLGSSADRSYLLGILPIFNIDEPELRIAAADAIGMIGPQDSDAELLAPLANDPVPDVRRAASQMFSHGKGEALSLLGQRTVSVLAGMTPETPADPGKYSVPVAPDSTYLFYASNVALGRLSYIAKNETAGFFKTKAKKGPFKLEEFQDKYRYQLQDEQEARQQIQDQKSKQLEKVAPTDPTNMKALSEYMDRVQSGQAGEITMMLNDSYHRSELFGSPTVYVLEERQIGQRGYPTRYVVLYQDLTLKRPGYRLSWITVPDDAIKTAQAASLVEEKQEAARKKENEALKKRAEALDNLEKKKNEQEKSKFKKGQADLEKELGF